MATRYGKRIVTDGLVLCLDAADNISAPHNDLPVKQGLLAWWDAADDSTVTLSGSNVTQWRDKSGNSYHMSPSGTGPTRSNTQNSKSVLTFTAAQDIRDNSTDLNLTTTTHTVVVVSRYTTGNLLYTNNAGRILQGVSNNWLLGAWDSQPSKYYAAGWVTSSSRVSTNDTTWGIHTGTGDYSNDVWAYIKNGTDLTVSSGGGGGGPNRLSINSGAINENSPCEVAELIVFNRVLSSDELTKVHNYLQNKWNIEVSDAKWYDRTANTYNGTLTNDPVYSETDKGYFDFDGSDDKADCGSVTPDTGDFTIEFIYQLTGNGGRGGLFERKGSSPYNGFSLGQGGSGHWGFEVSGTSNFSNGLSLTWTYPTLNTWYHDVGVYSGGNSILIYRNGSLVSSTSGTSQGNLSTQGTRTNFLIANRDTTTSLPCKVGLVRVYNTALSAAEILQNYNATKGRYL